MYDEPYDPEDFIDTADWFKPMTIDFTRCEVDPELLNLLTGGVLDAKPDPTFSIDVVYPIKRTFWQWLRRKPVQHQRVYIPNARIAGYEEES